MFAQSPGLPGERTIVSPAIDYLISRRRDRDSAEKRERKKRGPTSTHPSANTRSSRMRSGFEYRKESDSTNVAISVSAFGYIDT